MISHSVNHGMKNVSDGGCRENQNTRFIFSNFSESRTFMKKFGKMCQSQRGHRREYVCNMVHGLCMLDN
jgi:hypothetical protein